MPHINDGGTTQINVRIDRFRMGKPIATTPADTNCSLCAAAAAIFHATGRFTTSGDVARENPPRFKSTDELAPEFRPTKLKAEVLSSTVTLPAPPLPAYQHSQVFLHSTKLVDANSLGSVSLIEPINEGVARGMADYVKQKIGCTAEVKNDNRDAVIAWMKGKMQSCIFTFLTEGHWLFAHQNAQGVLEFIDYQTDKGPDGKPTVSSQPVLGITRKVFGPSNSLPATAIAFVIRPPWTEAPRPATARPAPRIGQDRSS
jgi:hypothetical protein